MPPHLDHGLLTLIIQNQVGGLQVQHQDKWIHVNGLPNSLLVNTGDYCSRPTLVRVTDGGKRWLREGRRSADLVNHLEVVNHGIQESLMKKVIDGTQGFFNLKEEEKKEFEGKHVLDPIRYGTSFNTSKDKAFFWRDYLKVFVHPKFHSPSKPDRYSDVMWEYCEKVREVTKVLFGGISQGLGLEECYLEKTLEMKSGFQLFIANYYPCCPQPELALGMPPHSDHGLLTLIIQNQVGGLQVQHQGKWIHVNALPNSLLVNTGDHLEIFSNGKYKSNVHKVVVNNTSLRISVAVAHGPSLEAIVSPASPLVQSETNYIPMKYKDYMEMQQSNQLHQKSILEQVKIQRN